MNLLENSRRSRITQAPRRDQLKLNHMVKDINRNRQPSKTISLMYANKDNKENIVMMEKEKKSVSMIPKERMNEIRLGEKGDSITLNKISKKISANQVKNVHSGYNKYWTFNGAIYAVKPGSTVRVDNGSTPSVANLYDVSRHDVWFRRNIYGQIMSWTTLSGERSEHINGNGRPFSKHYRSYTDYLCFTNLPSESEYYWYGQPGGRRDWVYHVPLIDFFAGEIYRYHLNNKKIHGMGHSMRGFVNDGSSQGNTIYGGDIGLYNTFRRGTYNARTHSIISWNKSWELQWCEFDNTNNTTASVYINNVGGWTPAKNFGL